MSRIKVSFPNPLSDDEVENVEGNYVTHIIVKDGVTTLQFHLVASVALKDDHTVDYDSEITGQKIDIQ